MIIELSTSFSVMDVDGWRPYHLAIEHLIQSHGQGNHIFAPSRAAIECIEKFCDLSRTQREILDFHIKEKITNILSQARSSDYTLLCVPDGKSQTPEKRNQIVIPLSAFNNLQNCGPAQFITENANVDGIFLNEIARFAGKSLGYSMNLSLDLVHGGGDTTASCYERVCDAYRPALCIVDSDRKFEGDGLGDTAKKVARHDNSRRHGAIKSYTLPVRELENVLPLSFLLEVYSRDPKTRQNLSKFVGFIENCRKSGSCYFNAIDFFDFKKGLKVCDVAVVPEDKRSSLILLANYFCSNPDVDYDDISDNRCIVPAISENVLAGVVKYLQERPYRIREFVDKLIKSPAWQWLEAIIRLILSFGAAAERLPIR